MSNERVFTCQICGRAIKLTNGLIAHHGYKRPSLGWQTASCMGAKFQPYEFGRDRIPAAIDACIRYAEFCDGRALELTTNPPESMLCKAFSSYERDAQVSRPADFNPEKRNTLEYQAYRSYFSLWSRAIADNLDAAKQARKDGAALRLRYEAWVDFHSTEGIEA